MRRLRPPIRTKVPLWDLAIVLEGLVETLFELLEPVPVKLLTVKKVFHMTIISLKRIGGLQALSTFYLQASVYLRFLLYGIILPSNSLWRLIHSTHTEHARILILRLDGHI